MEWTRARIPGWACSSGIRVLTCHSPGAVLNPCTGTEQEKAVLQLKENYLAFLLPRFPLSLLLSVTHET